MGVPGASAGSPAPAPKERPVPNPSSNTQLRLKRKADKEADILAGRVAAATLVPPSPPTQSISASSSGAAGGVGCLPSSSAGVRGRWADTLEADGLAPEEEEDDPLQAYFDRVNAHPAKLDKESLTELAGDNKCVEVRCANCSELVLVAAADVLKSSSTNDESKIHALCAACSGVAGRAAIDGKPCPPGFPAQVATAAERLNERPQ